MKKAYTKVIDAGGGVVYRRNETKLQVLIIHRRGVWDLPKGKIEPGESVREGAVREVQEETGCTVTGILCDLGSTVHYYREDGQKIKKRTWWFAMQCKENGLKPQSEEEIDDLKWVSPPEAVNRVHFENLKVVMQRFITAAGGK